MATPSQVIIIRHAEKPEQKSDDLSAIGFKRAEALEQLFEVHPELTEHGKPEFLFAAKYISGQSSKRSIQTITPLSAALNLQINTQYVTDEYKNLAKALLTNPKYAGRSIFISWTHSNIPGLAKALGSSPKDDWNSNVFDRLWVLNFDDQGRVTSSDMAQRLLPGDSN